MFISMQSVVWSTIILTILLCQFFILTNIIIYIYLVDGHALINDSLVFTLAPFTPIISVRKLLAGINQLFYNQSWIVYLNNNRSFVLITSSQNHLRKNNNTNKKPTTYTVNHIKAERNIIYHIIISSGKHLEPQHEKQNNLEPSYPEVKSGIF